MRKGKLRNLLTLFLAGMLLIQVLVFWHLHDRVLSGYPDFTIFYSAAKIVRNGQGHRLYDMGLQYSVQREFSPRVQIRPGPLPYNHPPFEAVLFLPFTFLSFPAAYLLWAGCNLAMLFGILLLLRRRLPELRREPLYLLVLGALTFFPAFIALLQGQDSILLALLCTSSFLALRRGHDVRAGAILALALFKPHFILPLAFVIALKRQWRVLLGFLSVAAGLMLISLALVGSETLLSFPGFVWRLESSGGQAAIHWPAMPNLRGLLSILPGMRQGTIASGALIAGLSAAVLVYAALRWFRLPPGEAQDLGISLAVIAAVLSSYHAYSYDLSLLMLPALLILNYALRNWESLNPGERAILLGPILMLLVAPLHLLLLLRLQYFDLIGLALLVWGWALDKEVAKQGVFV